VEVEVGDGQRVRVPAGLSGKEQVVLRGNAAVCEGDVVRPQGTRDR
jgi:hypothetical protein